MRLVPQGVLSLAEGLAVHVWVRFPQPSAPPGSPGINSGHAFGGLCPCSCTPLSTTLYPSTLLPGPCPSLAVQMRWEVDLRAAGEGRIRSEQLHGGVPLSGPGVLVGTTANIGSFPMGDTPCPLPAHQHPGILHATGVLTLCIFALLVRTLQSVLSLSRHTLTCIYMHTYVFTCAHKYTCMCEYT